MNNIDADSCSYKCLFFKLFRDPNLWTVKCRIGTEKETVMILMRKCISLQFSDTVSATVYMYWCVSLININPFLFSLSILRVQ